MGVVIKRLRLKSLTKAGEKEFDSSIYYNTRYLCQRTVVLFMSGVASNLLPDIRHSNLSIIPV